MFMGDISLSINIRPERADDFQGIHETTIAAFLNIVHTDHNEQLIVKSLRDSGALTISWLPKIWLKLLGMWPCPPLPFQMVQQTGMAWDLYL